VITGVAELNVALSGVAKGGGAATGDRPDTATY
jgi:hypothetical protein